MCREAGVLGIRLAQVFDSLDEGADFAVFGGSDMLGDGKRSF